MKVKDKQRVIMTAVAFFVVSCGIGALNFFKFKERSKIRGEIARLDQEEQLAEEKIKKIPELLDKRSDLVATINRYVEILPPEEEVQHIKFVNIIDKYRQETAMIIQKAEYVPIKIDGATKASQRFIRHRYRFKLIGTFSDFLEFVNRIENHTRFLKVDSFTIKPFGSLGGFGGASARAGEAELMRAANSKKDIDLTVSTYTYYEGA